MKQNKLVDSMYKIDEEKIRAEYVSKNITDDFIFAKVMQKEENCIDLLERLTGNKIDKVTTVISQKVVKITNDSKGVRYDIYVEDDKEVLYDAEMQKNADEILSLPKRTRFYQGMIDLNILEKGEDYRLLKDNYVIFICTFDPFGKDFCCYEFENFCKDDTDLKLDDGRHILFYNTKGTVINVSKPVKDLLNYMESQTVSDDFTQRLDSDVDMARHNREWMVEYMKTLVHEMDIRHEAKKEGKIEGKIEAIIESIIDFLSDCGEVPESLKEKICKEHDVEVLKEWNKLSAKVDSIEEFREKM